MNIGAGDPRRDPPMDLEKATGKCSSERNMTNSFTRNDSNRLTMLHPNSSWRVLVNVEVLSQKAKEALARCNHKLQILQYSAIKLSFICHTCHPEQFEVDEITKSWDFTSPENNREESQTQKEMVDDSEDSVDYLLKDSPDNSIDDRSCIDTAADVCEENEINMKVKDEEPEDMLSLLYPEVKIKEDPENFVSAAKLTTEEEVPLSKSSKVGPGTPGLRLRPLAQLQQDIPTNSSKLVVSSTNSSQTFSYFTNSSQDSSAPAKSSKAVSSLTNISSAFSSPTNNSQASSLPSKSGRRVASLTNNSSAFSSPTNSSQASSVPANSCRTVPSLTNSSSVFSSTTNTVPVFSSSTNYNRVSNYMNNSSSVFSSTTNTIPVFSAPPRNYQGVSAAPNTLINAGLTPGPTTNPVALPTAVPVPGLPNLPNFFYNQAHLKPLNFGPQPVKNYKTYTELRPGPTLALAANFRPGQTGPVPGTKIPQQTIVTTTTSPKIGPSVGGNTGGTRGNTGGTPGNSGGTYGNTSGTQSNTAWTRGNTAGTHSNTTGTRGIICDTQQGFTSYPTGIARTAMPQYGNNSSAQQLSVAPVAQAPQMNKRGPVMAAEFPQEDQGITAPKYQINQLRHMGLVNVSVAKNPESAQQHTKKAPQSVIVKGDGMSYTSQVKMLMKNYDPKQVSHQVQMVRIALPSESGQVKSDRNTRPMTAIRPKVMNSNPRPLSTPPQTGYYTTPRVSSTLPRLPQGIISTPTATVHHGPSSTPRVPQGIISTPTATVHHGPSSTPKVPVGQPVRIPMVPGMLVGGLSKGQVNEQLGGGGSQAAVKSGGGGSQPEGGGSGAGYRVQWVDLSK